MKVFKNNARMDLLLQRSRLRAGEMAQWLRVALLFQRTWVQFPAPTWQITVVQFHSHTHRQNTNVHEIKINII